MKCPDCGSEMKPLATSMYCPKDCDRKVAATIDNDKTPKIKRVVGTPAVVPGIDTLDDEGLDEWIDSIFNDASG